MSLDLPSPFLNQEAVSLNLEVMKKIQELVILAGAEPDSLVTNLISQMIESSLKMTSKDYDLGQLKLMARAFKEMRYAYQVFNENRKGSRCVSIFGSARTSETHPNYRIAMDFSSAMVAKGWTCMTGAAEGIMRAGLEAIPKSSSFGLSIKLPFEDTTQTFLSGDPKLINFRFFFTRKLMFLSQSDALAAFPGGVGTQDELFEALTLMQTGKSNIVPLVLLEEENGTYWQNWEEFLLKDLLANGWISAEDQNFYYRAKGAQDAVDHVQQFYRRYHSSRYVKDTLIIRLLTSLTEEQIAHLNEEFASLILDGKIYAIEPLLPDEKDHLDLPRIAFRHNRRYYGLLRMLINRINQF